MDGGWDVGSGRSGTKKTGLGHMDSVYRHSTMALKRFDSSASHTCGSGRIRIVETNPFSLLLWGSFFFSFFLKERTNDI